MSIEIVEAHNKGGEVKTIPIVYGEESCCFFHGNPPLAWGNYFSIFEDTFTFPCVRVCNFWIENLRIANERLHLNDEVRIRLWSDGDRKWCIIDDDRIPDRWYYHGLCFTGYMSPPEHIKKEMEQYLR